MSNEQLPEFTQVSPIDFAAYAIELYRKRHGRDPSEEELANLHKNLIRNEDRDSMFKPKFTPTDINEKLKTLDEKIDGLIKLSEFHAKGPGLRVLWQDKVSKAGIDLGSSSAVSEIEGVLLGVNVIPTGPNSASLMAVCRALGTQNVVVLDITKVSFLD